MPLNTATVLPAVTSTIVGTFFSHYLNRKPLKQRPTAHLSYDEGLHLVRSFLQFSSRHPVEDLQAFTAQWVPAPQWIKNTPFTIPEEFLIKAAELITADLGDEGIELVGGRKWWQWRIPGTSLNGEWIEMKSHAAERKKDNAPCQRVMLYIHGGAYYFGSIDDHRYQMQRHARKLKARVFAPRYRLSPQFPFPCGIQDCLAAYLYLLTQQDASTIIIAGDSAGGGMTLALLCLIRNQGLPMPAGGILVSPWVDLTHSFPSVAGDAPMDYIPQDGFHHKPSRAWPPLNVDDLTSIKPDIDRENGRKSIDFDVTVRATAAAEHVTLKIDGDDVTVKDQIQMYTTNSMLKHPLVSPALQPTLGGLPPLLVLSGGGEILRDEQIFLAHKCANPQKYAFPDDMMSDKDKEMLAKYPPTDVQLQCWEDLCHVVPLLSFTRPAKYMYRSIAQFGAWALARAQHTGIEIPDDDAISVISSSNTDTDEAPTPNPNGVAKANITSTKPYEVGKAGDPLPKFTNHMIRQHVTRHGVITPLVPEEQLPACTMDIRLVGELKATTAKKWLAKKNLWDEKFVSAKQKVLKQVIKESAKGWRTFGEGERPPPAALANRRTMGSILAQEEASRAKKKKSLALSLWTMLGSKHDDEVVERERQAEKAEKADTGATIYVNGSKVPVDDMAAPTHSNGGRGRSRSRSRVVVDEHQTEDSPVNENTPVSQLVNMRKEREAVNNLSPDFAPETGVAGKRPHVEGIAMPFTLDKEPETASMMTLHSTSSPADGEHLTTEKSIDNHLSNDHDLSQANTQQPDAQDIVAHTANSDKLPANLVPAVASAPQG